jgi:hypothetical protein
MWGSFFIFFALPLPVPFPSCCLDTQGNDYSNANTDSEYVSQRRRGFDITYAAVVRTGALPPN